MSGRIIINKKIFVLRLFMRRLHLSLLIETARRESGALNFTLVANNLMQLLTIKSFWQVRISEI